MKTRASLVAAGAVLAAFAMPSAVFADPTQPTTPSQASDWSGSYVGLSAGRPTGDNTWSIDASDLSLVPGDWSGTLPRLTLGHDWQRGRLTYGAALSLSSGDISAAPQSDVFFSCFECNTVVSDLLTLRVRAGLSAGKTLVYAAGGLAQGDVSGTSGDGQTVVNSDRLTGWTLGLGVERQIAQQISLTASYDHTDLGSIALDGHVDGTDSSIEFGLMQIGVNYRW